MDDDRIEKELADLRVKYFENFVLKLVNSKSEIWKKMIMLDEHREKIFLFINKSAYRSLFFTNNGMLVVPSLNSFPLDGLGTSKFAYFLRKPGVGELKEETIREALIVGSCSNNPIRDLAVLTDSVYVPLLTNPKNQENWPKVLIDDVSNVLQELKNNISETMGNMTNRTILPLPITLPEIIANSKEVLDGNLSKCSGRLKESMEQVIIKWSRSIENVLRESPKDIWNLCPRAVPSNEIKFWENRLTNLTNIFNQLAHKDVKTMAEVLEKIDSAYVKLFQRFLSNVVESIHEARDTSMYLKPLKFRLDQIECVDFTLWRQQILPLVHTMMLIWTKSKYCCTNERIVHLFRMINNMLIEQAQGCLDPENIFQMDADDVLKKLVNIMESLNYYKTVQLDYQNKLETFMPPNSTLQLWTFKPEAIYTELDKFLERLNKLKEIFGASNEFKKIEDLIFGGNSGRSITTAVRKINEKFSYLYNKLELITFNPLSLDETLKFDKLYESFKTGADDLERSLSSKLSIALDECVTSKLFVKQMINMGSVFHRPIVYQELSLKLPKLLEMLRQEVSDTRRIFNEYVDNNPFDPNVHHSIANPEFPAPAGDYILMKQLRTRITSPIENLHLLDFDVFAGEKGAYVKSNIEDTLKLIDGFVQNNIIEKWTQIYRHNFDEVIAYPLLCRFDNILNENFAVRLMAISKFMDILDTENVTLDDQTLAAFWSNKEEIWRLRLLVKRIVEWNNFLISETHETERMLIEDEFQMISNRIDELMATMTWNNYDFEIVQSLFDDIKNLQTRVKCSQLNVKKVLEYLRLWNSSPLYKRQKERADNLLNIKFRDRIVHRRFMKCIKAKKLIDFVMLDSYRLLKNVSVSLDLELFAEAFQSHSQDESVYDERITVNSVAHLSMNEEELFKQDITFEVPDELNLNEAQKLEYLPYERYLRKQYTVQQLIL